MAEAKPTRPVLRYHGGKYRLGSWLVSHYPPHRCYVSDFCGAASDLLWKPRSYAEIINDLDGEIVSLFRVLRDPAQARELKRQLLLTPFARAEFELAYLPDGDPIEQARRTLIRSFMGFGSAGASGQMTGFRSDVTRRYTTPAADWANYADALDFFTERLRGVVIENRPALEVMTKYDAPDALQYLDPPYPHGTRSQKRRTSPAYRFEMSDSDHEELLRAACELKSMTIISGYACEMYDAALKGWHRIERKTFADGARERTEVLWVNEAAWKAKHNALSLFNTEAAA